MDNLNNLRTRTNNNYEVNLLNLREFQNISETIVNDVIDKFISYTVTISYQNEIEKMVPDKCWNYMQKILDNFIHLEFICHDRDDINLKLEKNFTIEDMNIGKTAKNFLRMDSAISKNFREKEKDNFGLINEIDTFENIEAVEHVMEFENMKTLIGGGFFENEGNLFFNNKFEGINQWLAVPEPVSSKIDRAASSCVKVNKYIPINKDNTIDEKSEHIYMDTKNNFTKTYQKKNSLIYLNTSTSKGGKKPEKQELFDRPIESYKLSSDEEEGDIIELRKAKNEEMKKKEHEIKVKEKFEKAIKEKAIESVKKQKEYERKNATTDADGKVIFIKYDPNEKFTHDFVNPRCEVKDKGETLNYLSPSLKPERIDIYPSQLNMNPMYSKKEDKQGDKSTPKIDLKSTQKLKSDMSFQLSSGMNGMNDKYFDRGPIVPGGSSYDQIIPEVGVTFYESGKSKFGGTDYFKAYRKYSHNDYLTILKHTQSNHSTFKEMSDTTSKINKVSSKTANADFAMTLPFINRDTVSDKINMITKSQFGLTAGSLKVSKNYTNFMKTAAGDLESIIEKDEFPFGLRDDIAKDSIDNTNLFKKIGLNKKDIDSEYLKSDLEEINNFNLSIVKNGTWGTTYSKFNKGTSNKKKLTKPDLKEIEREVGKNILNTKLPRSRVFSFVKPPSLTSSNFNKNLRKNKVENVEH